MDSVKDLVKERNILREIVIKLWANIFMICIIVFIALVSGFIFTKNQKPNYTATESVNYMSHLFDANDNPNYNITIMRKNIYSTVDFCTTNKVVHRADYYYGLYLDKKAKASVGGESYTVDDFLGEALAYYDLKTKSEPTPQDLLDIANSDFDYNEDKVTDFKYYSLDKVSSKYAAGTNSNSDAAKYIFTLSLTSKDRTFAVEGLRILTVSAKIEVYDFFYRTTTVLDELAASNSDVKVSGDVSLKKNCAIFGAVGLVLAIGLVFLKTFLDNTVKDKVEIENITGINVIAFIEKQEVSSNGRK